MAIELSSPAPAEVQALLDVDAKPKLTVLFPLEHIDRGQDAIRGRNLLRRANALLEAHGARPRTARSLIDPLDDAFGALRPLPRAVKSIAAFSAPGHQQLISLPFPAPDLVHVGDDFHAVALLTSLDPIHCHLLTIARGGCRLWRSDRWRLDPVVLPNAPGALSEITRFRDLERQLQLHSAGGTATFHGQGIDENPDIEPVRSYLRAVDGAVREAVGPDTSPLLLVGPGRLPAIYREVGAPRAYLPPVEIHPDGIERDDLRGKGVTAVSEMARERTKQLLVKVGDLRGAGKSSTDPAEIARAAQEGRVHALVFDPLGSGGEANSAVLGTVRHAGSALPAVDGDRALAAIFRY